MGGGEARLQDRHNLKAPTRHAGKYGNGGCSVPFKLAYHRCVGFIISKRALLVQGWIHSSILAQEERGERNVHQVRQVGYILQARQQWFPYLLLPIMRHRFQDQ